MMLALSVTNVESDLNHCVLKVTGLKAPSYRLSVDGADCGTLTPDELAAGIDAAAIQALPEDVQAQKLLTLTRRHNDLHFKRWRQVQVTPKSDGLNPSPDILQQMNAIDTEEAAAVQEQQKAAIPQPHKIVLIPQ
jgi:hypothetical protein